MGQQLVSVERLNVSEDVSRLLQDILYLKKPLVGLGASLPPCTSQ
jgi:hypothetical protein